MAEETRDVMPSHLTSPFEVRWTVTDRGFKHYAPVEFSGRTFKVYEASAATEPRLWVDVDGSVEQWNLEQASAYADQLPEGHALRLTFEVAIERHYQTPGPDPKTWKAGDPCAMCGSTDTGENAIQGAFCRSRGAADSDA